MINQNNQRFITCNILQHSIYLDKLQQHFNNVINCYMESKNKTQVRWCHRHTRIEVLEVKALQLKPKIKDQLIKKFRQSNKSKFRNLKRYT